MAKALVLKAELRKEIGSDPSEKLRRGGNIPAIIYGHKKEPVAISLNLHDLTVGLHHGHRLFDVSIGGKTDKLLVKDVQYDYLGKNIIHADLIRVDLAETIKVTVPIETKGVAQGTHEGGIVEEHVGYLEVECKVTDIPEKIIVSVKEIGVGDSIHAGDVLLPDGVKLASDPGILVVACHLVAAAKSTEELEAEAPAVPEVIGEEEAQGEAEAKQEESK